MQNRYEGGDLLVESLQNLGVKQAAGESSSDPSRAAESFRNG